MPHHLPTINRKSLNKSLRQPNWRGLLLALSLSLFGPTASAQLSSSSLLPAPFRGLSNAAQPPATPPTDPRLQAEAQLNEARRLQEAGRLASSNEVNGDTLPVSERQRTLDHLVLAYGERLKVLDEIAAFKNASPKKLEIEALIAELSGPPPYSAIRVDRLRNEFDALNQRVDSLTSAERALESEKRDLIEAQRKAAEAVRLSEDKLARASNQQNSEKESFNQEQAKLALQLIDAELSNISLGVERIKTETKILLSTSGEIKGLISKVVPAQRLSKEELNQQQNKLRNNLSKISSEIDRRLSENTRRMSERERLGKTNKNASLNPEQMRQLKLLDEQLETDRVDLLTMGWLQALGDINLDAWAQRYTGLNTNDAVVRATVVNSLREAKKSLELRQRLFREFEIAARGAARDQELRLKDALLDNDSSTHESAILDLQKQRILVFQRTDLANSRLIQQLDHWLGDFGFSGEVDTDSQWKLRGQLALQYMKSIWNFEMFAVEDSTMVDGKVVTTTYGITVGKSIGALMLFILTYWLASLLLHRLERLMVRRFGVNQQLASVIRRWSLITLATVLVVLILNLARIPLTAFAFLGGALAIGVGFGTQTIIKNVISGIIILFERKIRVGDIISLGGTTGYVTQVDLRASTVRGFDGIEALVPNSMLLENQVTNWTYSNQNIRREIRIGIAYGAPAHDAAEIILSCAKDHGEVRKDPPPEVFFEDFGDNALQMVLVFWVELGPNLVSRRVDSNLRYAMEKRLAAAGIGIPYPQRTIHLSVSEPLPVRSVPPAPPAP